MAAARRFSGSSIISRLGGAPWRFRFFQAVRLLERQRAQCVSPGAATIAGVGEEANPVQRAVRFRAATRLSFPVSEIDQVADDRSDAPQLTVTFLGLTGPSAVLPQHYSVAVQHELRNRNTALRDFFDLFNERLIAFFYRAWAKYRIPISVERGAVSGEDGAREALRGLIGFGTDHLLHRAEIAEHALLHYAGILGHFPRNATSLEGVLRDYFGLSVQVDCFDGRWLLLPEDQRTRLPAGDRAGGTFGRLSIDTVIGESFWDVESSFTIRIGPIDYAAFESFMPDGANLRKLADLVRIYIGPSMGFRVELCLRRDEVPLPQLLPAGGIGPRLGWNTWLRHHPMTRDASDAFYRL